MRCLQLIEAAHATTLPARARRASRSCSSPKPRRSPARREDEVACSASAARAICSCASAGADGKAMPLGISTKARQAGELICSQSRSPQYCQWPVSLFLLAGKGGGRAGAVSREAPLFACSSPPPHVTGAAGLRGAPSLGATTQPTTHHAGVLQTQKLPCP